MKKRTTAVTVRLGAVLTQQLVERAEKENANCAELLRKALESYLSGGDQHDVVDEAAATILARLGLLEESITKEIRALIEMPAGGSDQ
jgi:hypothetical protein